MKPLLYLCLLGWMVPATFATWEGSVTIDGYVYEYYENNDANFCKASLKCSELKGFLAASTSETINSELNELANGYTWLGAHDLYAEDWIWINGDKVKWHNWGPGEPNNHFDEDCLALNAAAGGIWFDADCNVRSYGYICQIPLDQVRSFHNSEFTLHEDMSSFAAAQNKCATMGARMVQIETNEEAKILREQISHYNSEEARYWIARKNGNDDLCLVSGPDGLEKYQCDDIAFGTICETARPHQVAVSDEQPEVLQSGDLEIDCAASGYPVPDVYWYRDDTLVSNQVIGDAKSRLLITNASLDDAGRYVCVASSDINGKRMTAKGVSYVSVI